MRVLLFSVCLVLMASCSTPKQACCKKTEKVEKTCTKTEKDKCCDKHK